MIFLTFSAEKSSICSFLTNTIWYTLEDTYEIILGSFKPNAMTKFDVICQKASKTWIIGQDGHFWHFCPKSLWFWIFPHLPLLIHARQYLWDHFRKISVISNDKIWSYWPKIFKTLILCQNDHFWHFLPKNVHFEFFHKYHDWYTLENTFGTVLGSFKP